MRRVAILISILLLAANTVLLASCSVFVPKTTVLIYMCGSNLESSYGIASHNLSELKYSKLPKNVNVVVETGGAKEWKAHNIPNDKLMRYVVRDNSLQVLEELESASMGESSTLSDFLSFGLKKYPAERTMLIIWDHGAGTMKGACFDEKYNDDRLSLEEMEEGLKTGLGDEKLFAIGFDACLMADYEVADLTSKYADTLIASQALEMGEGWDYDALVNTLHREKEPSEVATQICDAYIEKCRDSKKEASATLSAIDLTKFGQVREAMVNFSNAMNERIEVPAGRLILSTSAHNSTRFGTDPSGQDGNLIDFASVAELMSEKVPEAKTLRESIDYCMIHKANGPAKADAKGLSIYYPVKFNADEIREYYKINKTEEWNSLIHNMYGDSPSKTIEIENPGYIDDSGFFHVKLTQDSERYMMGAQCILSRRAEDGKAGMPIYLSYDVDANWDDMSFTNVSRFKKFTFCGREMPVIEIDTTENTETYVTLLMLNNEMQSFRFAKVYDGDSSYCQPIGIVSYDKTTSSAGKDIIPINEGDLIRVNREDFVIGPEGVVIEEVPIDDNVACTYQLVVYDIFGNDIASDIATFENVNGEWRATSITVDNAVARSTGYKRQ